jgi:hypothetical protein
VVVEGVTLKVICVPVLATASTWGSGFAPPATAAKDSGGMFAKVCALATAETNRRRAGRAGRAVRKERVESMGLA